MKRKVWFEPVPTIGLRGVVLKESWFKIKILYRDVDSKCRKMWVNRNQLVTINE